MRRRTIEIEKLFLRDLNLLKEQLALFEGDGELWVDREGINNSAGNLFLHICGNLRHFIGSVLGDSGYTRERDREFNDNNVPRAELESLLDQTIIEVKQAFSPMLDTALDDPYPAPFRDEAITTFEMLLHLYGHLNYHYGQINYFRRIRTRKYEI